jgi:hypothetical protein
MGIMNKFKEIKKEIEQIIFKIPPLEKMISDIEMSSIYLKQKQGDVDSLYKVNRDVVERIWRTLKTKELIDKKSQELKNSGLNKRVINEFFNEVLSLAGTEGENAFSKSSKGKVYLELEVYKTKKQSTN